MKNFCIFCGKKLNGLAACDCIASIEYYSKKAAAATIPTATAASTTIDDTASTVTAVPKKFCIYCGKTLVGDEKCVCQRIVEDKPITPPVDEEKSLEEITRESRVTPGEVKKRFCTTCGKTLYGDEMCSCEMTSHTPSATPEITPVPSPGTVSGGLKINMKTKEKPLDPQEIAEREEGKKFLNKATDLE